MFSSDKSARLLRWVYTHVHLESRQVFCSNPSACNKNMILGTCFPNQVLQSLQCFLEVSSFLFIRNLERNTMQKWVVNCKLSYSSESTFSSHINSYNTFTLRSRCSTNSNCNRRIFIKLKISISKNQIKVSEH